MEKEIGWLLRDKYAGIKNSEFEKDVERLKQGVPLAYVIGWTPFLNTKIWLDSKPLIPRPETEFWVEKAIKEISKKENPRILDLCAGSGCIGVAVLKNIPNAIVDFVEIDTFHHATILKNIEVNGHGSVVKGQIFGGNLFENIIDRYDFILTNPPYINPKLAARTEESVKIHEPEIALWGGIGGTEIIEKIISEASKFLNPGGMLYIEHEPEQSQKIIEIGSQYYRNPISIEKDQFGVERYSIFRN